MPVPCREQIAAAVLVRLQSVALAVAERERTDDLTESDFVAGMVPIARLDQFEDPDQDITEYSGEDAWQMPLRIQGAVAGSGVTGQTALNNLRALVLMALRPAGDWNLGGLARHVEIADTGATELAGVAVEQFKGFVLQLSIQYATREGDPFTFADA